MGEFDYAYPPGDIPRREDTDNRESFGEGASCPECGGRWGPAIIGEDWWYGCALHRLAWCIGTRITDDYKHLTADDQRAQLSQLDGYRLVPAFRVLGAAEKAAHERLTAARGGAHAGRA